MISPQKESNQDAHTSVKVHAPPGGKSNFVIGGGFNDAYSHDEPTTYGKKSALNQ